MDPNISLMALLPYFGSGAIAGLIIPGLISLKIFARREELAEFRAFIAENYIHKEDFNHRCDKMEGLVETRTDKIAGMVSRLSDRMDRYIQGEAS